MDVALYARVSTRRQQQTQTIDQQLTRLQAHVAAHPEWRLAEEHMYRDDGYSGAKLSRPGLDRLRDHAALAAFECVVLTAPDRLARTYVHQVLLIDELAQRGCAVAFVDRPMSDDPHDQRVLQIRGAVAEYERTLIADRMRRGRQAKLRGGQLLPWTRAPYGYILDAERPRDPSRVRLDPVAAAVVTQIFAWYTDAQTPTTLYGIAKRLSDERIPTPTGQPRWNVASMGDMLRSPAYTGTAYSGRTRPAPARHRKSALRPVGPGDSHAPTPPEEWIAIPVPAIVSQETFDAAQVQLERNRQMARRHNTAHAYLLRGLVSCGQCQLACTGRSRAPGYAYYLCRGHTDAPRAARGQRCTARFAPAVALDDVVWQDLCRVIADPALLAHEVHRAHSGAWLPQALQARQQTVRAAVAQLERQQERLLAAYLAEIIDRAEFARKRQEILQTLNGLAQQLRHLEAQAQQQHDVAAVAHGLTDFCQHLQPTLDHLTFDQRRQLVELLIDRVIVDDGQVEIRYVIPTGPKGAEAPFCHLRLDYLDLPARAQQDEGFPQGQQRGRDAGDHDGPVAPGPLRRAGRAATARRLHAEAASALVGHLLRNAHGEQARGQAVMDAEGDVHLHGRRALSGEQIKGFPPFAVQGIDGGPWRQTREPIDALRRHGREHPEREEAQITDAQRATRQWGGLHHGAAVGDTPLLHQQSAKLTPAQIIAHMEFERRRARTAVRPPQRERRRQGDGRGVQEHHGREALQQGNGDGVGGDHCLHRARQQVVQEHRRALREPLVERLRPDRDPHDRRDLGQPLQRRLRIGQPPKDQHLGKERPGEFGGPLHKARPPRERIRCRREDLLQRLGELCYRGHRDAPLTSKVIYTLMMPKGLPSPFLRLMHMGCRGA